MAVTDKKFEAAANDIKQLTKRPDDEDMLRLYALYKQGSDGDVQGERPGAFSFVDRITHRAGGRIEGEYTVPAAATRFPASLMAEAVGQLAAWSAATWPRSTVW